ncbi:tRNA epoxyqueuosine(34) reductase QueG [Ferruginibacter sp. HRS2-29]|uniref:tRNA epoxyqueuosine(34) reductase QueG n=1 Tax=Ferruginibacter sp. HRS2-29 TaxID=2487334 RepID=UPI0020CFE05D|nr:tRNA epoxyqueuosine(34) reductase QueG [Ferruginibacter sp. HRS2-29]MCP9752267.1 tRNA epoxyqueuosine(34) reductase QueG [Ferruginibacter sp. HRS2-29]
MNATETHTAFVKQTAAMLGFEFCGIAKAQFLDQDAQRLETWLSKGMHGNMHYMQNHFDLRVDPTKLVPGARSVITLLLNYFPETIQDKDAPKIAKYAYGNDYHEVIREKLNHFFFLLKEKIGGIQGRGFVDSAPVLERSWAQKAGMGWIGKNGNLINKQQGSYFFIASLIVDVELTYDDGYAKDYCGSCTRCIDSCPTEAILPDKVVDGSKCISYFTIELKEALLPEGMKGKFDDWLFGCDTCQDVCPWNRFSQPTQEAKFKANPEILHFSPDDWEELTEESFKIIFRHSPIKRTKFNGIKRNLQFIRQINV